MPRFHFRALDEKGAAVEGELDAADEPGLIAKLRELRRMPVEIQLAGTPLRTSSGGGIAAFLNKPLFAGRGLKPKDLTVMTRELATLLAAGLPLDRALAFLAEISESASQQRLIAEILEDVRSGSTLADALDAKGVFAKSYVSLVRAGESGNALTEVLARLATFLDQSEQLRQQVVSALVYPAILLVMSVLSVVVLLTLVLPQFTPMFDQAGAELPLLTEIVLYLGDIVQDYWWLMLLLAVAAPLVLQALWREPASRKRIDQILLKLPLAGDLAAKADTATLTRTVGTLLSSGVALPTALRIASETLGNTALRGVVGATTDAVREGKGFADPLARSRLFPKLATHLIAVGEKSGELEMMLLQVASIFDREVKATVDRLMTLLVPLLTIGVGLVIAMIIGAILSAILASYQLPI